MERNDSVISPSSVGMLIHSSRLLRPCECEGARYLDLRPRLTNRTQSEKKTERARGPMVSSVSDRVLNVRYPGLVIASKRGTGDNLHNRRLAPYPKTAPNAITKVDYLINILKQVDAKDTTIVRQGIKSSHQISGYEALSKTG